jgi:hypothetical protein
MRQTCAYRYDYRGIWRPGASCGIAVFVPEAIDQDRRPLILCTELGDNPGTSITNLAEVLAAEIIARHFSALLDAAAEPRQPVRWIERYPAAPGWPAEYDEVTFTPWRIRVVWCGGMRRRSLGTPDWRPLRPEEIAALFGPSGPRSHQEDAA